MKKIFAAVVAGLMGLTLLSACSSDSASGDKVVITSAYARATDDMSFDKVTNTYMTGVFMTITNNTGSDLTLSTGTSSIAPMVEVHEVVDGVMRKKEGGLLIKSGATEELMPGGNHVMLMGMSDALVAGSEVSLTLTFDDGTSVEVTAPVKVVNLEQEHYHSGSPAPSMTGM